MSSLNDNSLLWSRSHQDNVHQIGARWNHVLAQVAIVCYPCWSNSRTFPYRIDEAISSVEVDLGIMVSLSNIIHCWAAKKGQRHMCSCKAFSGIGEKRLWFGVLPFSCINLLRAEMESSQRSSPSFHEPPPQACHNTRCCCLPVNYFG